MTVFGAICTALNFTSMLKVYSSNKENVTKCYVKYTSIQCLHSRLFLFCITVAAQMQQMSLFNSLALRQIRNHVIDDNNYIWNLSWVVSNNDRFDHHEWWDCLKLHDQHWAKSIYHKIVQTRAAQLVVRLPARRALTIL